MLQVVIYLVFFDIKKYMGVLFFFCVGQFFPLILALDGIEYILAFDIMVPTL